MTTLSLIVKGSPAVAERAAMLHGFKVERSHSISGNETRVRAEGSLEAACYWLCEPGDCLPGKGYADGSLLFYR